MQEPRGSPRRRRVLLGAKFLLAVLLLAWLAHSGSIAPGALLGGKVSASALGTAALCVFVALALGVYRWRLVMGALGVPMRYPRALQVYWIGAFASTFLPGAATGDLLRAIYVARETPLARTRAAASVVIDRGIGLLGFVLSGLMLMLLRFDVLRQSAGLRDIATTFAVVLVAVAVCLPAALWMGKRVFGADLMARTQDRLGSAHRAVRTQAAALGWPGATRSATALGLSLAIPTLLACALLPFIPSGTLLATDVIDIGIASNAAQVANTLPLTPGGIGIGEGAFEYVLSLLRQPAVVAGYATAFLSLRLVTLAVNAFGGVLLLLPGNRAGARAAGVQAVESGQ